MKTEVKNPCRKCGSHIFYVYDSRRQCVACRDRWAKNTRAEVEALRAEVTNLRGILRHAYDCLPDMPLVCCQTVKNAVEAHVLCAVTE